MKASFQPRRIPTGMQIMHIEIVFLCVERMTQDVYLTFTATMLT